MSDGDTKGAAGASGSVTVIACVLAVVLGGAVWTLTMANARDLDNDNGGALILGLGVVATSLGAVAPKRPLLVGALVTVGALVLAPWTAPRGDGDGLWILILPMLLMVVGGTAVAGLVGAKLRMTWLERR